MNDIWALPTGEWVVYSDEENIIKEYLTLADLKVITSYHGLFKKRRAVQFKFPNREDILRYICFVSGFNYGQAVKLLKRPGSNYNDLFGQSAHQPPLFIDMHPRRKGRGSRTR